MIRRVLKRAALLCGLTGLLTVLAPGLARAGTDVFGNVGPASPVGGQIFGRYPLDHYELDHHFSAISASLTGGVDASGLLPTVAYFFASVIWFLTSFAATVVVELFAFAFNLDLVNGSSATGGAGAVGPVSQAIHSIYADAFGAPWLVLAISVVGMWAMWKALVQRRYSETAGALGLSLVYVVVALFFVLAPGQTIGQASRFTNEMSRAFLSVADHGDPTGGGAATADDADELWSLLGVRPWAVLQFGGLEHCVLAGTGDEKSDPDSVPVRPLSPNSSTDAALARRLQSGTEVQTGSKVCVNNLNKYARHFLRFGEGTDERNEEYDALDHGDAEKLPDADDEKAGYNLGVADKPATDAMEEGGQTQRLMLSVVVAVGELGALLLLGSLSIGVILSQVLLLLLLAFSPIALVAAAIPGRGHDFFKAWLEKLGGYLLRKAAYSLVLAVLLAVNAAIGSATSSLGWLFAFGLQGAFFWAVLLQRRTLTAGIVGIATGPRAPGHELAADALSLYAGARFGVRAPLRGAVRAGGVAASLGGAAISRARGRRGGPSVAGVSYGTPAGGGYTSVDDPARTAAQKTADSRSSKEKDVGGRAETASHRSGSVSTGATFAEEGEGRGSRRGAAESSSRSKSAQGVAGAAVSEEDDAGTKPKRSDAQTPPAPGDSPPKSRADAGVEPGESGLGRGRSSSRVSASPVHPPGPRPRTPEPSEASEPVRPEGRPTADAGKPVTPERREARRAKPHRPESGLSGASAPKGSELSEGLLADRQRSQPGTSDGETAPSRDGAKPPPNVEQPALPPAEDKPTSPPRRRRPHLRLRLLRGFRK